MPRLIPAALSLLAACAAPASAGGVPPIGAAGADTGVPGAVYVPGYGIGYAYGPYPPPGWLVGPFGARFSGSQDSPVVIDEGPPPDPSPTSIYRSADRGGRACAWRVLWTPPAGRRWQLVC